MDLDDLNLFSHFKSYIPVQDRGTCGYQFTSHAALNGLFPERQSAYRQFHSTESAVLALHNYIVSAIDQSEVTGLVLFDLSSAIDTVDQTSLLSILESRFSVTGSHWHGSHCSPL